MSPLPCRLAIGFCCWFVIPMASQAQGQPKPDVRKVVVSASANVNVKADTVRVTFGLTTQVGINAREEHEKHVKKMKAALAGLSISGIEILSVPSSISTVLSEDQNARFNPMAVPMAPLQAKQAQTQFVVTIRDNDSEKLREKAIKIADVASEMGGNSEDYGPGNRMHRRVDGMRISDFNPGPRIEWLAENGAEARLEVIRKAIKIANENARAAVSEPLHVIEINVNVPDVDMLEMRYRIRDEMAYGSEGGLIAITANVRVTFGY
jgi:uncharacterized protein YggE